MAVGWRRNDYMLCRTRRSLGSMWRAMLPANLDQDFMADGFPRAKGGEP